MPFSFQLSKITLFWLRIALYRYPRSFLEASSLLLIVVNFDLDFIARIADESNKKCLDKKKTKIST